MTKANSEYFELNIPEFSSGERYFETATDDDWTRLKAWANQRAISEPLTPVSSIQQAGRVETSAPIHVDNGVGLYIHDSLYAFLKTLGMDDLWDTYPVKLYEKDGKTPIPNYHHGLIVKQHVKKVVPPWATPRTTDDPLFGSPGIPPLKGTWFDERELKDDRLFMIGIRVLFRKDIKEKIEAAFPVGLEWKNLREV